MLRDKLEQTALNVWQAVWLVLGAGSAQLSTVVMAGNISDWTAEQLAFASLFSN